MTIAERLARPPIADDSRPVPVGAGELAFGARLEPVTDHVSFDPATEAMED